MRRSEIQIRDPYILVCNGQYYMYGTTDENPWGTKATGFDHYISKDLELWQGPFPSFRPPNNFWADIEYWAPEVHEYKGKYYMFASFKSKNKCRGTQVLVSNSPEGSFSKHSDDVITPKEWECLDGTLYVDNKDQPWMVFCHEWIQVQDGEICAVKLSNNLKKAVSEPILLFTSSTAPWVHSHQLNSSSSKEHNYVTDGPFIYTTQEGRLVMLWSSFSEAGYAIGIAKSSNDILGPWVHETEPLPIKDGGHGMIFRTLEGRLMLTIHTPNNTPFERPVFIEVFENKNSIIV